MYQRYIANPDGTFRKTVVDEPPRPMPPPPPEPVCAPPPPRPELACPPERPRPPEPAVRQSRFLLRGLLPGDAGRRRLLLALIPPAALSRQRRRRSEVASDHPRSLFLSLRGRGKWVRAVWEAERIGQSGVLARQRLDKVCSAS